MFGRNRFYVLSAVEQQDLLKFARNSIAAKLSGLAVPNDPVPSPPFESDAGAFVTLTIAGSLRGCIGIVKSTKPLYLTIQEAAEAAAFKDPRFPPLSQEEFEDAVIEISIISPPRKINSIRKIKVKRHGLLIKHGSAQGLLLPQVAAQNKWNRTAFLEHACLKAGLDKQAWKLPDAEIMVFDAQVFKEPETVKTS